MKITNVEAIILDSGLDYGAPESGEESAGVRQCVLIKVSTDEGITGWSDVETSPQVCAAAVDAPATGSGMVEGLCLERGFTAIKFGWGVFGVERKRDVALVRAAREAIGPDIELLVDPGWKVERSAYDAIALLRDLEPFDIYWLEDFLHPENYAG